MPSLTGMLGVHCSMISPFQMRCCGLRLSGFAGRAKVSHFDSRAEEARCARKPGMLCLVRKDKILCLFA